jgi:DNA-binding Lrp family transcriptional regulator
VTGGGRHGAFRRDAFDRAGFVIGADRRGFKMTVRAFILIDTSPGKAKEVVQKLRGVQGVIYAHTVTGPHDIIALVESADVSSLGELVVHKIQSVAGVNRSLTSIVAD